MFVYEFTGKVRLMIPADTEADAVSVASAVHDAIRDAAGDFPQQILLRELDLSDKPKRMLTLNGQAVATIARQLTLPLPSRRAAEDAATATG